MSLDSSLIDSMEQNQPQMSCYSETYHLQEQHYAPDTSTSEPPEYEAVSSTSHLDMGLGLNESCRFAESNLNTYPIIHNREAYLSHNRVGVIEDLNKPKAVIRPTVTREFVSSTGEKLVLSHLVQHPTPNGRNVYHESVKKRKRTRTAFTDNQIKQLEDEYASNRYLDQQRRQQIAKSLSLFERTVKIWFQNRRMKEKKMIREANEQSGDEDPQRDNFRREYYAVPTGVFPNSQPSASYEEPQMSNNTTPNNSYGYGMCPPTYSEAVSFYPSNSQHYSVIIPDSTNIMNMGYYNGQNNGFSKAEPSVQGYSTQNETLRAAMSTLNVEDTNRASNMVIEKYIPQTFATDEEMKKEVTCSEKFDSEVISGDEISKNEFINLDSFFQ